MFGIVGLKTWLNGDVPRLAAPSDLNIISVTHPKETAKMMKYDFATFSKINGIVNQK